MGSSSSKTKTGGNSSRRLKQGRSTKDNNKAAGSVSQLPPATATTTTTAATTAAAAPAGSSVVSPPSAKVEVKTGPSSTTAGSDVAVKPGKTNGTTTTTTQTTAATAAPAIAVNNAPVKKVEAVNSKLDVGSSKALGDTKTPSNISNEVIKKARNASFKTRVKLGLFAQEGSEEQISTEEAKRIFLEALDTSKLLSKCSPMLKEELFRHVVPVYIKKGDLLFSADGFGQAFYVVIRGEVNLKKKENGAIVEVINGPGTVLSDYSVMMNIPHEFSAFVEKPGLLLAVHRLQYQMAAMATGRKKARTDRDGSSLSPAALSPKTDEPAMSSDLQLLSEVPLFAPLMDSQVRIIFKAMVEKTFAPGQKIIKATESSPGLFVILAGEVILRTPRALIRANGERKSIIKNRARNVATMFDDDMSHEVEWLGPGDYFSEASLLSGGKQSLGVDVIASDHQLVRCLLLSAENFSEIAGRKNEEGVPIIDLIRHDHIVRLLGRNSIFSKLGEEQLNRLAGSIELKYFKVDEVIVRAGSKLSETNGMFIVIDGLVKLVPELAPEHRKLLVDDTEHSHFSVAPSGDGRAASPQSVVASSRTIPRTDNETDKKKLVSMGSTFHGFNAYLIGEVTTPEERGALLGEGDKDYAVLLAGDSFGEDSIIPEKVKGDMVQPASIVALGGVTCGCITRAGLTELNILDAIISALNEEKGGVSHWEVDVKSLHHTLSTKFFSYENISQNDFVPSNEFSGTLLKTSGNMFKILRVLHHTTMTDVYIALHKRTGQVMVIKSLNVIVSNKNGQGQYVFAEQTTLSQLNSPFVAHMISGWEEEGSVMVALEPALGGGLSGLLTEVRNAAISGIPIESSDAKVGELGGLAFEAIRFYSACVLLALKHLYEHNICHRDLKPPNMVLDHHGYLKLMDFGIAKQLPPGSSRTTSVCGTPRYMAPELAARVLGTQFSYGLGVDWWAFGVTIFEMACGYGPFSDDIPGRAPEVGLGSQQKSMNRSFAAIGEFALRGGGMDDPIFDVFRNCGKPGEAKYQKWHVVHEFISALLTVNPSQRLGVTYRGPREAMIHPLFQKIETSEGVIPKLEWDKLLKRAEVPPIVPKKLLIDPSDVEALASESKASEEKFRQNLAASNIENHVASASPVDPVENQVRGEIENNKSGFMGAQIERAEKQRKQLLVARKQNLKRVVYKQGKRFDDLDLKTEHDEVEGRGKGDRRTLAAVVLQRVALAEAKHFTFLQSMHIRVNFDENHDKAAIFIQRRFRGNQTRKKLAIGDKT